MAGIRAQYFEDLEEIAGKAKEPQPGTPGEKLYKMLVGDEEILNSLGADKWEKLKVGKYGWRLVIGSIDTGEKVCIGARLMKTKGTPKLFHQGFTVQGASNWEHFKPSSQDYSLLHPDLNVSLWIDGSVQKQLFDKTNKREGEGLHGRWLARIWRHVFPDADIERDGGSTSASETPKKARAKNQTPAGPSTSTAGGRSSNSVRMRDLAATTHEEPEAEDLNESDGGEASAEKQGIDQMLLAKYGFSKARDLWEAFNKHSGRFQLEEVGMVRLLQRGLREKMPREDELNSPPDQDTLRRAKLDQTLRPSTLITDTLSFRVWERKVEGGCTGGISFIKCPSQYTLAREAAEKEKEEEEKKKKKRNAMEKPDGGKEDEEMVRILSESDEEFMRKKAAVKGLRFPVDTWVSKSDLKALKKLIKAGTDSKGGE
ncbi:hypothetical protein KC355_g320 [Hortaea werneckii]|nr:hypothetical protein KC355_g320 [Hortaea werneckii]